MHMFTRVWGLVFTIMLAGVRKDAPCLSIQFHRQLWLEAVFLVGPLERYLWELGAKSLRLLLDAFKALSVAYCWYSLGAWGE
jgi:hypothetical protein